MSWRRLFQSPSPPARLFSAWQIELTTRCPLSCLMCPREGDSPWRSGDMDFREFEKLALYFQDVETVILEGWGESLLYKNLIEAVKLVKKSGARAGFVTSGMGLDKNYARKLIAAGVDFIGFSLAGVTSQTHNAIRVNSDLSVILSNIKTINEIKAESQVDSPRLHLVYLLLRDNISEAPGLPELARQVGAGEVVLTNLIQMTNEWQKSQGVFRCSPDVNDDFLAIIKRTALKARELKITLRTAALAPEEVAVCEENPLRNLYIATDGEVSPCVYLHPPSGSPFSRIFCGEKHWQDKVSFGNIFKEPFAKIWNGQAYTDFREHFLQRKKNLDAMNNRLRLLDGLASFRPEPLPDFPAPCRSCHKTLGL